MHSPGFSLSALLTLAAALPASANPLTTYEGFGDYAAGTQIESGSNGSSGTPVDGGLGWAGPYNVNNAIKSLVRAENRTSSPVVYNQGDVSMHGGDRALRLYDVANGAYVLQRPMSVTFTAAAGDTLWLSFLFRTNNPSPLADRDFLQVGFDDNPDAQNGTPRIGIGATTVESTFPPAQPFRFFAKSTTSNPATVFATSDIASGVTYLLVGRLTASGPAYDSVDLFINPTSTQDPGPPAATATLDSGLAELSHLFLRTSGLDAGDAYVLDEIRIGRSFPAVVAPPPLELHLEGFPSPTLRWSALLGPTVSLQSSTSLASDTWITLPGPFPIQGTEFTHPTPTNPHRQFFRLWKP